MEYILRLLPFEFLKLIPSILVYSFLLVITDPVYGTNYYISSAGNDGNDGTTISTPWKTINKLNSMNLSLKPGDVVHFRRGDIFIGQINLPVSGTSSANITITSYGTGHKPVIKGSIPVNGWTQHSGNIWKAAVNRPGKQVFLDGKRLPEGRHPNTGYFRTDATGTQTSFKDREAQKNTNFYTGSKVVLHNTDYHWVIKTVSESTSSGGITLESPMKAIIEKDAGYFFISKLEFLDSNNEWFFDQNTGVLYYYSSVNPLSKNIQISVFDYGIKGEWNRNNITITELSFFDQAMDAIWLRGSGCKNNRIENCDFVHQRRNGLSLMGPDIIVRQNTFYKIGGIALEASETVNLLTEGNSFKSIGIYPGVSDGGVGDLQAIRIWNSTNVQIIKNFIDSTGYGGITANSTGGFIKNNIADHTLLITSDGGGLYCWGSNANNINFEANIIENVVGNVTARPRGTDIIKAGIYLDNGVYGCKVINNTLVSSGIYINAGTYDNSFIGNNIYNSNYGIRYSDWYSGASVYNMVTKRNAFYTNTSGGVPVIIESDDNNYNVTVDADSNYYCNPFGQTVAEHKWSNPVIFNLEEFKALKNQDKNTKASYYQWRYPEDYSFILINKTGDEVRYQSPTQVNDLDDLPLSQLVLNPYSSKYL
ncbi:MAG: NosD domain-containing protein [Cytophagaceae bacterium]